MKERPINLKAWEVQAIRAGRKTQFRRVVKHQERSWKFWRSFPTEHGDRFAFQCNITTHGLRCPYGAPGDRLWARETWAQLIDEEGESKIYYSATEKDEVVLTDGDGFREWNANGTPKSPWRSPVCMPRWASRITLEVVSVRVERLNEISEEDAKAEGVSGPHNVGYPAFLAPGDSKPRYSKAVAAFESLWQSINGPGSWEANPWVWVVEFRQCE